MIKAREKEKSWEGVLSYDLCGYITKEMFSLSNGGAGIFALFAAFDDFKKTDQKQPLI